MTNLTQRRPLVTSRRAGFVVRVLILLAMLVPGVPMLVSAQTPMASPAAAVATLEATSTVIPDFPVGITIRADLTWDGAGEGASVELLYAVAGDATEQLVLVDGDIAGNGATATVEAVLGLQAQFVPPGVEIVYRWRLVNDEQVLAESAPEVTLWQDTRWDWQSVSSEQVTLHYYGLSAAFADQALASSQATVTELEQRFQLARSAPLDIWVYPSAADFQAAKPPNSRETIAGASFPGYNLILAIVPDGSTGELGRVILHEISHQVLYQATANPFTHPPLWFDEGMATQFQIGGTDGYLAMAATALANDALFDLESLDVSFPYTPSQATLAYAASWSAVEYIMQTYGDEGIAVLIAAMATGVSPDDVFEAALGVDLAQLNTDWRSWLAAQAP